jgi:hypothetical protein
MTQAAAATPPVPGTPEHDAAMIARAEQDGARTVIRDTAGNVLDTPPAGEPPQGEKPPPEGNLILGKFKTQEDLVAAYKALETKLGAAKPAAPPAATPPGTPPAEGAPQATPIQTLFDKAAAEYASSQQFTPETVTALESAGVPRSMIDNYVAGLQAQAQVAEQAVYGAAGGKAEFETMQAWAATNLTAEQIDAFNYAVGSGDINATKGAIANLKALYTSANGSDPAARVERQGGSGNEPPADMYRSKIEVQKDMNDPRYKNGEKAFHALVDRKLEAAMRAGIDLGF